MIGGTEGSTYETSSTYNNNVPTHGLHRCSLSFNPLRVLVWEAIGRIPRNRRIKGARLKFSVGVRGKQTLLLFRLKINAAFSSLSEPLIRACVFGRRRYT